MPTRALLTAGNPQGDVLFGVDNNPLSRALEGDLFEEYESPALESVDPQYAALDREFRTTPIDHADVYLNYDRARFAERGLVDAGRPRRPRVRGAPRGREPGNLHLGLAFLLATIARYGESGWQEYWRKLRANEVLVVDGWEEAYTAQFSGAAGSKGAGRSSSRMRRARQPR